MYNPVEKRAHPLLGWKNKCFERKDGCGIGEGYPKTIRGVGIRQTLSGIHLDLCKVQQKN